MHDNGNLHFHDGSFQMLIYFGDFPRPFLILLYYSYIFLLLNFSKIPVKFLSDGRIIEYHIECHRMSIPSRHPHPSSSPVAFPSAQHHLLQLRYDCRAKLLAPSLGVLRLHLPPVPSRKPWRKVAKKMSIWVIIYWGKWMIRHGQTMLIHDDPCTLWLFNIAMGNGPFIDGLPIKNGDFPWLC